VINTLTIPVADSLAELSGDIVLAIGVFDGVHRGHQRVFQVLKALAEECAATPVALFFDPPPRVVLRPQDPAPLLVTWQEKVRLLAEQGVKIAVKFAFTREFAAESPEAFVQQQLLGSPALKIHAICVGTEWRFGAGGSGDVSRLQALTASAGVRVVPVEPLLFQNERISSTRIRKALLQGDFPLATQMLGRPFTLTGQVVHGMGKAATDLHCPTANLDNEGLLLPPYGVYAARTRVQEGASLPGIVYIGDAPTFRGEGNGHPIVELHLFQDAGDLYGKAIRVEPVRFLRESRVFPSHQALADQIQTDIRHAKEALEIR
jgi:riboflavin kinase / FMN adenylyltransferase